MIDLTEYTFAAILSGLLSRIPDELDKREGSIIYDALAPAAYEFASLYSNLAEAYADSFVATATGQALDMRGAEMGITRREAVKAVRLGKFYDAEGQGFKIGEDLRFSTLDGDNSRTFTVLRELEPGVYYLEDTEGGAAGNSYIGELLPTQYVDGLARAELIGDPIIDGSDAESDEEYRARYLYKIKNEPCNGNTWQYLQWALEYPGIGKAKVFPLWDGPNTVKVSVLGTDDMPCSPALLADFQAYLDPGSQGLGNGVAPIGSRVTVSTVELFDVTVSCSVQLSPDTEEQHILALMAQAVRDYFNDISYKKEKVYYMEVGAALLSVEGVFAISDLKINNNTVDIAFAPEERPILSDFRAEVTA